MPQSSSSRPLGQLFGQLQTRLGRKWAQLKAAGKPAKADQPLAAQKPRFGLEAWAVSTRVDAQALAALISPFEAYLSTLQRLLIWEHPPDSLVALLVFHCTYW